MVVISCYSLERDNQNAHPKLLHFADVMYYVHRSSVQQKYNRSIENLSSSFRVLCHVCAEMVTAAPGRNYNNTDK